MTFSPIGYGAHSMPVMNSTQMNQSPGIPSMPVGCESLVGSSALLSSYSSEQHLQAVAGLYAPYAAAAGGRFALGAPDPSTFYMQSVAAQQSYAYPASAAAAAAWRGAHQAFQPGSCAAYPYEPNSAASAWHTAAYAYPTNPSIHDLNGQRRKNATRESTATLKAWLTEHKSNPYPTKGEKIMLAIITKMTLTQVSTWFANARRRLKKDNKMTWSPRNRGEDDDDDEDCDEENDDSELNIGQDAPTSTYDLSPRLTLTTSNAVSRNGKAYSIENGVAISSDAFITHVPHARQPVSPAASPVSTCCRAAEASRPKIWSLAYTATSCSPPPAPKKRCSTPTLPLAGIL